MIENRAKYLQTILLLDEIKYFSDCEEKAIEYFPFIYQKVFLTELSGFMKEDEESLNDELKEHGF